MKAIREEKWYVKNSISKKKYELVLGFGDRNNKKKMSKYVIE